MIVRGVPVSSLGVFDPFGLSVRFHKFGRAFGAVCADHSAL